MITPFCIQLILNNNSVKVNESHNLLSCVSYCIPKNIIQSNNQSISKILVYNGLYIQNMTFCLAEKEIQQSMEKITNNLLFHILITN